MDTKNQNQEVSEKQVSEPEVEIEQVGYRVAEPRPKFGYSKNSVNHNIDHFSSGSHHKADAVVKSLEIAEKARLRSLKKR